MLNVSKLTQAGFDVEFNSRGGCISRGQKRVWFDRVGGMYRLKATPALALVAPVEAPTEAMSDGPPV